MNWLTTTILLIVFAVAAIVVSYKFIDATKYFQNRVSRTFEQLYDVQ